MNIAQSLAMPVFTMWFGCLSLAGCHASPSMTEPDCSGLGCASRTVQALVPAGAATNMEARKDFVLNGQRVALAIVACGELRG